MPQQKPKPSTAAQRADEALKRVAPEGRTPARRTLAFLLEGSHDEPSSNSEDSSATSPASISPSDGQTPSDGQIAPPPINSLPAPIAPERNYNKRANSIERIALPSGMFPGASKKIYDALYVRTRGAINPCRTIRATKKDLREWTGLNNRKTLDMHMRYLETCGLIERRWELGNTEGYLFEVRLPEENPLMDRGTVMDSPPEWTDQKRDRGTDQKRDSDGQSQLIENKDSSEIPKTYIRLDQKFDDEALADLTTRLREAAKEVTGKDTTSAERLRWAEVGDVLVTELKIAAARTSVTSAPAFLAEHLRRRLWKKDKQTMSEEKATPEHAASSPLLSRLKPEEIKACPDCGGTGFYYPTGYEGGVAKCRHQTLLSSTDTQPLEQG